MGTLWQAIGRFLWECYDGGDSARRREADQWALRRYAVKVEQARRDRIARIMHSIPPPILAEGDMPASVEARRQALARLYRELHQC